MKLQLKSLIWATHSHARTHAWSIRVRLSHVFWVQIGIFYSGLLSSMNWFFCVARLCPRLSPCWKDWEGGTEMQKNSVAVLSGQIAQGPEVLAIPEEASI